MSMTTVSADASQSMFEFLHSELVSYLQEKPPGSDKVRGAVSLRIQLQEFLVLLARLTLSRKSDILD